MAIDPRRQRSRETQEGREMNPDGFASGRAPEPTQPPQTFSEMQRAGRARPAPPQITYPVAQPVSRPLPPVGTPQPSAPPPVPSPGQPGAFPQQLGGSLQQAILASLGRPSAYGSDEVMRSFDRLSGRIDDDYSLQKTGIDEEMARRGIYDSTIAGGRLHDLNIGRRSARTELGDSLLDRQAQTYGSDLDRAIGRGMSFGQQGFENQLATAQMNQGQDQQMMQLLLAILGLS